MTNWNHETRAVEIRTAPGEGNGNRFEGRACTYGVKDAYGTTFFAGCFTRGGLDTDIYPLLWQHDPTKPVGTFHAEERMDGLYIVGQWDDTNAGRDARMAAMSGSAAELSVGFMWSGDLSGDITEARLLETSQVTKRFAAVPGSVLTAIRSALDAVPAEEPDETVAEAIEDVVDEAQDVVDEVVEAVENVIDDAKAAIAAAADAVEEIIKDIKGEAEGEPGTRSATLAERAAALAAYVRTLI